jgi:hypothetical protein
MMGGNTRSGKHGVKRRPAPGAGQKSDSGVVSKSEADAGQWPALLKAKSLNYGSLQETSTAIRAMATPRGGIGPSFQDSLDY